MRVVLMLDATGGPLPVPLMIARSVTLALAADCQWHQAKALKHSMSDCLAKGEFPHD